MDISTQYPGKSLRLGDEGTHIVAVQMALNRVSQNYPSIPKIDRVDGVYTNVTRAAVRRFQEIFGLPADGNVDSETYNNLAALFAGLTMLCELEAAGARLKIGKQQSPPPLKEGDTGSPVMLLEYYLSVIHTFLPVVPDVAMSGEYDEQAINAVMAFQRFMNLPETGYADELTWDMTYRLYEGIAEAILNDKTLFPYGNEAGMTALPADPRARTLMLQHMLGAVGQGFEGIGAVAMTGAMDGPTVNAVKKLQEYRGLPVTGIMDFHTWKALICLSEMMRYAQTTRLTQYPGRELKMGMRDEVNVS